MFCQNLFHELSLLMREAVLDPPHIRQVIESSIESARFGKFKSIGNVPGSVPAHIQFVSEPPPTATQKNITTILYIFGFICVSFMKKRIVKNKKKFV